MAQGLCSILSPLRTLQSSPYCNVASCKLYRYRVQWLIMFCLVFNSVIAFDMFFGFFFFLNRCRQNTNFGRRVPCESGKGVTSTNSTEWYLQALILLKLLFFLINMIDCNKFVVLNVTSKPLEANCCSVVDRLA